MLIFPALFSVLLLSIVSGHEETNKPHSRALLTTHQLKLRGGDTSRSLGADLRTKGNYGLTLTANSPPEERRGQLERRASEGQDKENCDGDDCMMVPNATSADHDWDDSNCRRVLQWNHSQAGNHSCDDDDCEGAFVWHCGNRTHDDSQDWNGSDEDCEEDLSMDECDGRNCTRCGRSRNGTDDWNGGSSLASATANELANSGSATLSTLAGLAFVSLQIILT